MYWCTDFCNKRDALLADDHVVAYLGLAESSDMEDADFS